MPWAALRLGRPVKWIEDRREHFISANHERGQMHDVEVAFDDEGRILALHDRFVHDNGAYTPYGIVVPIITSTQLLGPYRLPHYAVEFDVLYTNTVLVTPYRGAGRPHGAFVMERVISAIARALGLESAEVRRRNFIQPHEFPCDDGLTFQDGGPTKYDSGDYPAGLEMALERAGFAGFRARQAEARAHGRYLGLGIGVLRRGHRHRPLRGRARARGAERHRARGDGRDHAGPGPLHDVRADRRRGARLRSARGDRRHRRHAQVQLGRRDLREPRAGDERQRHRRRRAQGPRQGGADRGGALEVAPEDLEIVDGASA